MNNLVDKVKNAQTAVTLHPQLDRKKANQFSLDRKRGYIIRAVHTKRNYATHTTRYMERKVIRSAQNKSYAARPTKYHRRKSYTARFTAVGCRLWLISGNN